MEENDIIQTGFGLRVTGCELQVTGYRLQVTGYRLRVRGSDNNSILL